MKQEVMINFGLMGPERNITWQNNHDSITKAMSKLMRKHGRVPSNGDLAAETGLTVATIYKHLKEFGQQQLVEDEVECFKFLTGTVLATLQEQAREGDIRAIRLALQIAGVIGTRKGEYKMNESR